jgi:hypothetical protein
MPCYQIVVRLRQIFCRLWAYLEYMTGGQGFVAAPLPATHTD